MICVDDGLLSHHIMLPLFDILYQGIELLVVGMVVEDHPMKYFKIITKKPSSLHQDYSQGIPTCIYLHFEGLLQYW
jgi:hypothetical protein